jgi:hypothetical protein
MPNYETPEPISLTLELGVGNVRIAASDRTDTVVEVRPSDEADESDVKTTPTACSGSLAQGLAPSTSPARPGQST